MSDLIIGGTYRHYKNGHSYRVIDIALHTDTQEKMVIYKALYECPDLADEYGTNPTFTRPYDIFMETVEFEGKTVPRFKYVGE